MAGPTPRGSRNAKRQQKVHEETAVKLARIALGKWIVGAIGIPLSLLALTPTAAALADKDTKVNVSVALTLTVGITCAWGVTGAAYTKQRKRADRIATRNEQLQLDVAKEQSTVELRDKEIASLQREFDRLQLVTDAGRSSVAVPGAEGETG